MVRLPIGLALCMSLTAQAPPAEATRLSLQEAIRTSLQNNLQVEIAQQARQQTKAGILTSEGVFDWNLSASLQASQAKTGTLLVVWVLMLKSSKLPWSLVMTTRRLSDVA